MTHPAASTHTGKRELLGLSLGALGIVYGDIGTSPLYSLRECFHGEHGMPPSHGNVLGVLSLVFWVLIVTISIKYLVFVMRADNRGEGGILALLALVPQKLRRAGPEGRWILVALGIFGAALLYGDGMITPAISVLSAVEGLSVATPFFNPYVVPITLGILFILFLIQRRGTAGIGALFGPVMILWFAGAGGARRDLDGAGAVGARRRSTPGTPCASSSTTAGAASWCSARSSWWSPAARRSTPTWGTSGGGRSGSPGSPWCSRRCCSTTSARGRCCSATRTPPRTPSTSSSGPARPRLDPLPDGGAVDGGHDHRLAGGDLGRLLAHPPGGAARLHAADQDRAHLAARRSARSTSRRSTGC